MKEWVDPKIEKYPLVKYNAPLAEWERKYKNASVRWGYTGIWSVCGGHIIYRRKEKHQEDNESCSCSRCRSLRTYRSSISGHVSNEEWECAIEKGGLQEVAKLKTARWRNTKR